MTNELSVREAVELLKEKRMEINYMVNGTTQYSKALDMGIKALESQQTECDLEGSPYCIGHCPVQDEIPRWIPANERLPEEDGQYLITVKYKHVNDSYEDVYAEHGEWFNGEWDMFCFGHCGEVEDITAWMPLPEPYGGEE